MITYTPSSVTLYSRRISFSWVDDVNDGYGCIEVWEHIFEQRETAAD